MRVAGARCKRTARLLELPRTQGTCNALPGLLTVRRGYAGIRAQAELAPGCGLTCHAAAKWAGEALPAAQRHLLKSLHDPDHL